MFNKEMEVEEKIEPAQYNRHLCCSYGSLFSIALNVEYMVWYRQKTKMFVDPQNAKTATLVFFNFFEYLT